MLEVSSDGELGASLDGFSILKAPRNLDEFRSLGLGKELFTTADNYMLSIDRAVAPDDKVRQLIMAAVMCIDMVLKE